MATVCLPPPALALGAPPTWMGHGLGGSTAPTTPLPPVAFQMTQQDHSSSAAPSTGKTHETEEEPTEQPEEEPDTAEPAKKKTMRKKPSSTKKSSHEASRLIRATCLPLLDCYAVIKKVAELEVEGERPFAKAVEDARATINLRYKPKEGSTAPKDPKLPPLTAPPDELETLMVSQALVDWFDMVEQVSPRDDSEHYIPSWVAWRAYALLPCSPQQACCAHVSASLPSPHTGSPACTSQATVANQHGGSWSELCSLGPMVCICYDAMQSTASMLCTCLCKPSLPPYWFTSLYQPGHGG